MRCFDGEGARLAAVERVVEIEGYSPNRFVTKSSASVLAVGADVHVSP